MGVQINLDMQTNSDLQTFQFYSGTSIFKRHYNKDYCITIQKHSHLHAYYI